MKKILYSLMIAILSYLQINNSIAQGFEKIDITLPKLTNGVVAWADYNNDEKLDFIITGWDGSKYHSDIYKNEGNNSFHNIEAGIKEGAAGAVAWGDYNNDGFLDLLITGYYYSNGDFYFTKLYQNNGDDTFTEVNFIFLPLTYCKTGAHFGDYDGDGKLDILLAGIAPGAYVKIYINEGNDKFSEVELTGIKPALGAIDWGDYDNDGDLDILLVGIDSPNKTSIIYRNDGNNQFTNINANFVPVGFSSTCKFIDYDNDEDLDVIISDNDYPSNPSSKVNIYKNEGNDLFKDINFNIIGLTRGSIDSGDYNQDGKLDLLITGYYYDFEYNKCPVTKIYSYVGEDKFLEVKASLQNISNGDAKWGDYDNDGDLDILITGNYNTLLYNNLLSTPTNVNGISEINSKGIIIYPNPAKSFIYIRSTKISQTPSLIRVLNQRGQVLLSEKVNLNKNSAFKMDLPKNYGIFFIEIINDSFYYSHKLLIINTK